MLANIEVVRRAFESNRSGPPEETLEVALSICHPDFVFESRLSAVEGGVYRGRDGVRRYFDDLADSFQEWHNEVAEMREVAPDTVLVHATWHGVGRDSGMRLDFPIAVVCRVVDGMLREMHARTTESEAMESAGI